MSYDTTPRPWVVSQDHSLIIDREEPGIADHHDAYAVADMRVHSLISTSEAEANAALIVRCVNARNSRQVRDVYPRSN